MRSFACNKKVAARSRPENDSDVDLPETRYAKTVDGVHIAYQVIGDGPIDLVFVASWVSNVERAWGEPRLARFFERLASMSRLILFDKRGTGLSDRVPDHAVPSLENRMDDLRAVMDAAASSRAALFGWGEGGPMAVLFAASYPQRTFALALYGIYVKGVWAPDYPWAWTVEQCEEFLASTERGWGTQAHADDLLRSWAPSAATDEEARRWWAEYLRASASPGAAVAVTRMCLDVDIQEVLSTIRVPTLVIHRTGDPHLLVEEGRYAAERIAGARLVELPGDDNFPWVGDQDAILDVTERFLDEVQDFEAELDRVLTTVMFTDIVGSTEKASELGDRQWRELLGAHDREVRSHLARFRGREVDTAGDGFLAIFDGPVRAVRCAQAIAEAMKPIGLEIRAGCHTGEVELEGDKVRGLAVHIGARVAAMAGPGQVLVSSTVKDLVAGSGLTFEDRGEHELKGVPDRWRLHRAVKASS